MSELFKTGQILGRSEMKKIMAGSGSQRCECYNIDGQMVGTVLCIGLDPQFCCEDAYGNVFAANCSGV